MPKRARPFSVIDKQKRKTNLEEENAVKGVEN